MVSQMSNMGHGSKNADPNRGFTPTCVLVRNGRAKRMVVYGRSYHEQN